MPELNHLQSPTIREVYDICNLSPYFQELIDKWALAGKMAKDLKKSFEVNGDEFFSELMPIVKRSVASQYYGKANPFSIWKNTYKKASRLAEQKIKALPKPIHKTMEELLVKNTSESFT